MQILENDERNIAITNASLAYAYKVTLSLLVLVLFALEFMGYMSKVIFFDCRGYCYRTNYMGYNCSSFRKTYVIIGKTFSTTE